MRERSIKKFLFSLDCENIETKGEWVKATCPLAPYTHGGGIDTRPSFGVSISPESESVYYCFGCSPIGKRLGKLLHTLWVASGRYPEQAAKIFLHEEIHALNKKRKTTFIEPWVEERKIIRPLPIKVMNLYPELLVKQKFYEDKKIAEWLVKERGILPLIYNMCRVRFSRDDCAAVFPLTDTTGNIFVLRLRSRKKKNIWTASSDTTGFYDVEFPKLKDVGVWFGMGFADWEMPLLLTEGELDAMRIMSLGFYNTIASATSSVTDEQITAIPLRSSAVFLGYDADKAGEQAHKRIYDRLRGKVPIYELDWNSVGRNDGGALKNSDELGKVLSRKKSLS